MKAILLLITLLSSIAQAQYVGVHHVNGYVRSSGTYVAPHMQTNPDHNPYNNYSTSGNVNPYTGQAGTKRVIPYGFAH